VIGEPSRRLAQALHERWTVTNVRSIAGVLASEMKDLKVILDCAVTHPDLPWCLATLVKTEGSSYRQPGARLLVHPDGYTIGFLTAGCLENEIAIQGGEVIGRGAPRLVSYDTRKLFGCDGRLSIYLERIPAAEYGGNFLTKMAMKVSRREACRVVVPYATGGSSDLWPDPTSPPESDGAFVQSLPPLRRLVVIGCGPEVAPMKSFAEGLGWSFHGYPHPDELPDDFVPDPATAAVVMTHKVGRDLAALSRLGPLGLPYLGLLGAKRRHRELLSLLVDRYGSTLPPDWLDTIHAPAGLDTGSESPEEIAFSIVAEAAAVLSGRNGGFLKEKHGPIHGREVRA
jgi:xanthine dehydrogenase accessory factor